MPGKSRFAVRRKYFGGGERHGKSRAGSVGRGSGGEKDGRHRRPFLDFKRGKRHWSREEKKGLKEIVQPPSGHGEKDRKSGNGQDDRGDRE